MDFRKLALPAFLALGAAPQAPRGSAAKGEQLFGERCALCHGGSRGEGPELGGILGRPAASVRGYDYSKPLRAFGLTWTADLLDRFLASPAAVVPGTRMVGVIPSADERRDLIAYLSTLAPAPAQRNESAPAPESPPSPPSAPPAVGLLTGKAAFGDFRADLPGVSRRITVADLPPPFATRSSNNRPSVVSPPPGALPRVPPGFRVQIFARDLENPRLMRTAPNGDVFVADSAADRLLVFRPTAGAALPLTPSVFAKGLDRPFGIAFYPPGPDPHFIVVANTNSVVRFPYESGDLKARGPAQTLVPKLTPTSGGHWTRDVAFSGDGKKMFVSVGSASNVASRAPLGATEIQALEAKSGVGATWGTEEGRADVRVFNPDGTDDRVFATGIRNCVGLTVSPIGDLWCATNERDGLGDDLVPDYVTRVRPGAFYGWPWYYLGDHEDPRRAGERPDLRGKVTLPDVLVQPHSAALEMTFYEGAMFPAEYKGDAFVAFHGSWNRSRRTGYKVVRVRMKDGVPTGEYEDFLTGLVLDDDHVWGRPVGVTVTSDGALLVSEDGNGTIWRVSFEGKPGG